MPEADSSLLRRYRKSLIAVLIFVAYAVVLFAHNLNVQQRLEQNLLDAASLELAKQADALSAHFSERHNTLANLAASDAVTNYFSGHDLGMTVEYGLGVHTQAVEDRFEHLIDQERLGETRIYGRIVLIDEKGQLIAAAGALPEGRSEDYASLVTGLGDTRAVTLLDSHDLLRFSRPVRIKDHLRGHVIAYSPISAIQEPFAKADALRPEALVIAATGQAVAPHIPALFAQPEVTGLLAELRFRDTRLTAGLPAIGDDKPIAVIKQGIDGSPLALAALITQRELSAHAIPSLFLAAVGAVPFLVLYIVMLEMRERRQVEHALAAARAEARAEAERLARARSDFIANMSHEIRTPLNAILGLAQTGERDLSGRQAKQQFARISDSGQHLLGIINDILDCAKIDAGKLSVEHIAIEPEQIIDNVVTLTAERAFERGLRFEVREHGLPARCLGDPLRISQVLINLLGNAIKFTEHGSVTLDACVEGDMLQLRVSDTGVGMSPDEISRLFQPFEQADSTTTRRFGGTGLGLSISAHLVQAMGGSIDVISTPGLGSRFEVRLPLIDAQFDAPPTHPAHIVLAGFPSAESTPIVADLIARGHRASAIEAPAATPPTADLIVIDARRVIEAQSWRDWLNRLRRSRRPFALAGRLEEINRANLPDAIDGHLPLIERPLRSRHFIASLENGKRPTATQTPDTMRLAGLTILAVDDNEINRIVLADMLKQEGARVECLPGGAEALAHLAAGHAARCDIVLTDIQMPGMDGYQFTGRLHAAHPQLPVLGITAHVGVEARERCLAAGMLAHITKPIDLDALVAEILRHCSPSPTVTPSEAATSDPTASPNSPATPTAGLIDWQALDNQFKGKDGFVTRIVHTAIVTYRKDARHLRALAQGDGDMDDISFAAHSIKGSAGALKAMQVQELAAATDLAARASHPDSRALAARLAEQLDMMILELATRVGEPPQAQADAELLQ